MRKLVSSSEAAEILGLSLQGVHYRIKKGQIKSMKKDGKTYVYVDQEQIDQFNNGHAQPTHNSTQTISQTITQPHQNDSMDRLSNVRLSELVFKAKDEQIQDLKNTIELVKEQYKTEIYRLDKNQKQILEVFQSEVEFLKSAFHEMKNVYQLEHKERMEDKKYQYEKEQKEEKTVQEERTTEEEVKTPKEHNDIEIPFMDLKEFFAYMRSFGKSDPQIKNIILERVKVGDKRFIYKKGTKEVIIFRSDFMDLV